MSAPGREEVGVVVLNWNGGEVNLRCLASLVVAGIAEERVLFVDNASDDGSLEAVVAALGGARVGLRRLADSRRRGWPRRSGRGAP